MEVSSRTEIGDSMDYSFWHKHQTDKVGEPFSGIERKRVPVPLVLQRHRIQHQLGLKLHHQMDGGIGHHGVGLRLVSG